MTNSKSTKLRGAYTRRLTCTNKSNVVGDPERIVTVIVFMPETEPEASWQSPSAYSHLLKMDMAGLAWEWMRRTPHYHSIYSSQPHRRQHRLAGDPMLLPEPDAKTAALVGLHFL